MIGVTKEGLYNGEERETEREEEEREEKIRTICVPLSKGEHKQKVFGSKQ